MKQGINVTPRLQEGVKFYTYTGAFDAKELSTFNFQLSTGSPDFYAENVRIGGGEIFFDFVGPDVRIPDIQLGVPVKVNVENGVAAIALAWLNGVTPEEIKHGMATFAGPRRRFDFHLKKENIVLIDDYAHHPTEINATLTAAKYYPHRELWCVFQPHTYTRTKAFMDEFAQALSLADEVILADIYAARETDTLGISSEDIVKLLKEKGKEAWYLPTFDEIEKFVMEHCTQGDLLITMGAGDVVNVGENLLAK